MSYANSILLDTMLSSFLKMKTDALDHRVYMYRHVKEGRSGNKVILAVYYIEVSLQLPYSYLVILFVSKYTFLFFVGE